ncbi:50S ribosomal protein L19 [bacterium Unc6]|nr:50S ribosomal protein L19 [bacterium Unc6]
MAALNSLKKIGLIESGFLKKDIPSFSVGDTVRIYTKITEEEKTRTQMFEGTVIRKSGKSISSTVILRKVIGSDAVEKMFPLHSPNVDKIIKVKSGKVRRARLYYLRHRLGKGLKIESYQPTHGVENLTHSTGREVLAEKGRKKQESKTAPETAPAGQGTSQ